MCNLFKDNVERPGGRPVLSVQMLKFCSSLKLMNLHVVCLTIIIFLWCMFCLEQICKSEVLLMVHKWRDTIWGLSKLSEEKGKSWLVNRRTAKRGTHISFQGFNIYSRAETKEDEPCPGVLRLSYLSFSAVTKLWVFLWSAG